MKIFVCVKHVPDTASNITTMGENRYDDSDTKFILNPYDEFGLEEAIRIVEDKGGEVVAVTMGKESATTTLRSALAMGADRAIHIKTDAQFPGSSITAKALKAVMDEDGKPDMIFTGKGSVDTEGFQTHYRLANAFGMPIVNDVSSVSLEERTVTVTTEIGNGAKQVVRMGLPCIIGATKGLNEPRYPKVMQVMKAKKKEIKEIDLSDLGIDLSDEKLRMEKLESAPERSGGKLLEGSVDDQVTELVRILKENEKVI
ncbi:MAG: electron transfer flavoprotein subunit beta/FixA family protein [Deltaproteobacteria bacterium]|nr:MAG: electron transfer flavoprotein subunit beta/FixA family protein [Deltaproteobacteria bacterium]